MQIGVDIGGTFTDIVALDRAGRLALTKVPSTPKDLLEGIGAAVTRVLARAGARAADVERFIHGTTVATNAILEQKGAVTAVLTTAGFEDVLELGRMKRSRMYDLAMDPETPTFLAPRRRRIGVRERLDAKGRVLVPLHEDDVRESVRALRAQGVSAIAVMISSLSDSFVRYPLAPAANALYKTGASSKALSRITRVGSWSRDTAATTSMPSSSGIL